MKIKCHTTSQKSVVSQQHCNKISEVSALQNACEPARLLYLALKWEIVVAIIAALGAKLLGIRTDVHVLVARTVLLGLDRDFADVRAGRGVLLIL